MDKFLEKYNFPILNQEEMENLNRLIKEKWEKNQINKIRNENGEIKTDSRNTKSHMRLLSATICQ